MIAQAEPAVRLHPFPGLRPFEPDEDHLFFGRERQVDELLRRLRTTRFLAVLGTSGCGKSSLVRSGLIPSLYGGAMTRAGSSWRIAILRPGEDPIGNLAAALDAPEALGGSGGGDELSRSLREATLRASNLGLIECIRQARIPERDNVLILIDQFEELFRFKQSRQESRDEAIAFGKLLLEASRSREAPIYVTLTMRSDFIGNCLELPGLPEAINEGLYLVPRMTRDELRSAITGPVVVGGGTIAPRLVSRLLNDVGDDPDQLPILQHALMRTWDRWEEDHEPGEPLDLRHYEAIGTMKEALSRHAEEAFGELDEAGRAVAETLFRALTERGEDGRGVRRPVPLGEVCELAGAGEDEVAAVVDTFRRQGRTFLMPPPAVELRADSILDLSHESLMRIWGRLRDWVEDEAQSARIYLGVARAAARHEQGLSGLWRDPELQLALAWRENRKPTEPWARRYDPSFARALHFLDASAARRDREIAVREARRRQELRRARVLAAVLGTAALLTLSLSAFAFVQMKRVEAALREAQTQKQIADSQATRAEREKTRAEEKQREALEQKGFAEKERLNAEQQSRIAGEQRQIAEAQTQVAQEQEGKARASEAEAVASRIEAEQRRSDAIAAQQRAEESRVQAESSERETRRLARLAAARALALQLLRPAPEDQRELAALLALQVYRLNRDNGGNHEDPDLFNALRAVLGSLRRAPVLAGPEDGVRALVVAPDGSAVLSGSDDGRVLRFDLSRPEAPPVALGTFKSGIRSLALGVGGRSLAAGFADGALRLWDLAQPAAPPRELASQGAVLGALAFSPKGSQLAAGRADGTISLFDLRRLDAPPVQLAAKGPRVSSLAFASDGNTLAAGFVQGGALLWAIPQAAGPRQACAGMDVRSLAFSPGGATLVCGTGRGEIAFWDLAGGKALGSLVGHASSVNSLSLNPRGNFLVSASSDATVRLWEIASHSTQPIVLPGHSSWVWSAAFTPDGERVVSGGADRGLRLWEARTERMARELCARVHRSLTAEEWKRFMPEDLPYPGPQTCPAP